MKILDLFCGAGGAAMGLHRAFPEAEIIGVDIKPQKNYPFTFVQADAMEYPLEGFDFIWASPPCQAFSAMRKGRWQDREHPDLIQPTRERLQDSGAHWCIENVMGAPLINPIMLCGTMFDLETGAGNQLLRHRLFESSFDIIFTPECRHNGLSAIGVYGGGQHPSRRTRNPKTEYEEVDFGVRARKEAMGIQWMTNSELSQAIPPAYSEYIGNQLKMVISHKKAVCK